MEKVSLKPFAGKRERNFNLRYALTKEIKLDRLKKLIVFMLDNPSMTRDEVAKEMGYSTMTLRSILKSPEALRVLRDSSHKAVLEMMPLGVKGFKDSLISKNDKIKYLASTDLLKSEKILGPERVDVTIQDNSERTIEELQQLIADAQKVPSPTIDAELIE